jgi:uncharacterized protein
MECREVLALLRLHEPELRAAGIDRLRIFGSAARGEVRNGSDIDVVIRFSPEAQQTGFGYFAQRDALAGRLADILGRPVDVVIEPIRKERLRREIEREAALAF